MILGAFLDAGLPLDDLRAALGSLAVSGYSVGAEQGAPGRGVGNPVRRARGERTPRAGDVHEHMHTHTDANGRRACARAPAPSAAHRSAGPHDPHSITAHQPAITPQPAGDPRADRPLGAVAGRARSREGAVSAAGRSRGAHSPDAGRAGAPARSRRARLDHRHRRRRVRDGVGRGRPRRLLAAERRRRHGAVGARPLSGAGAGDADAARRCADLQRHGPEGTGHADRCADRHGVRAVVRSDAGDVDRADRLRRGQPRQPRHAERAPDPDRPRRGAARGRARRRSSNARSTT